MIVPSAAGYLAFFGFVVFVLAPVRIDRAAQTAARRGDDDRARRLALIARVLHPFGLVGGRAHALAAIAEIRAGEPLDDARLARLGGARDPVLAEWYRLTAASAAGDHATVVTALSLPVRRAQILRLGFGSMWIRAVAETADPHAIVAAVREAERLDATLVNPERRAFLALEACSALGDVEGTRTLAAMIGDRAPRGFASWTIARALFFSGNRRDARALVEEALDEPKLHVSSRKLLERLASTIAETPIASARARDAEVDAALAHLRREAIAIHALAPLVGEGRSRAWLTYGLVAILGAYYVYEAATGDPTDPAHLVEVGGLLVPWRGTSDLWRLFTATLIHAGLLHLVFNAAALVVFGRFVEAFYGRARTAAIWIASTITSGITVALLADPSRPTVLVGASGAIFGLGGAVVAAVLVRSDLRRSRRGRDELRRFALFLVLQIVFDQLVAAVSGTAHIAGLVGGALAGALLSPRIRADA